MAHFFVIVWLTFILANTTNELAHIGIVIDKREELVFERRFFLDANLHLNEEGRKIRTALLVKAFKKMGHSHQPASAMPMPQTN